MIYRRCMLVILILSVNMYGMDTVAEDSEALLLAYVYGHASKAAQNIVRHLQDPHFLDLPEYRASFFVGEPGVGKTTLARAIAHKLVGLSWIYHFFSCGDFQGKHRGEISQKLKKVFDNLPPTEKNIVIIDELNQLFDHAENEHYDTGATSKTLWTFLDSQRGNNNFFLIGTMNSIEGAPQQIKSRLLGNIIWLEKLTATQNKDLLKHMFLNHPNTVLDPACTDVLLESTCTDLMATGTTRDLRQFVGLCAAIFREQDTESNIRTIRPEHITKACERIVKEREKIKWNNQPETEAQRQQRLHNHLIEKQDEAFVKQLYLQVGLMPGAGGFSDFFHSFARVLLSDTQMTFYKELQKNEAERERIEKETKAKAQKEAKAKNSWW